MRDTHRPPLGSFPYSALVLIEQQYRHTVIHLGTMKGEGLPGSSVPELHPYAQVPA
jgi:hypothetical protein